MQSAFWVVFPSWSLADTAPPDGPSRLPVMVASHQPRQVLRYQMCAFLEVPPSLKCRSLLPADASRYRSKESLRRSHKLLDILVHYLLSANSPLGSAACEVEIALPVYYNVDKTEGSRIGAKVSPSSKKQLSYITNAHTNHLNPPIVICPLLARFVPPVFLHHRLSVPFPFGERLNAMRSRRSIPRHPSVRAHRQTPSALVQFLPRSSPPLPFPFMIARGVNCHLARWQGWTAGLLEASQVVHDRELRSPLHRRQRFKGRTLKGPWTDDCELLLRVVLAAHFGAQLAEGSVFHCWLSAAEDVVCTVTLTHAIHEPSNL